RPVALLRSAAENRSRRHSSTSLGGLPRGCPLAHVHGDAVAKAGMDPRDTNGKIRTRGIEENDRAEGGIACSVTGDNFASGAGKIRAGLSEIPRIERDPLIFDLFDPRGDLNRTLLHFVRSEGPCGTENQGIVHASNVANTHRLLLVKSRQIARR